MFAFSAAPTILHKNRQTVSFPHVCLQAYVYQTGTSSITLFYQQMYERGTLKPGGPAFTSKCLQPHKHKMQNLPDKQALPTRMQMAKSDFGPGFRHCVSVPCLPEILKLIRANLHGSPFEGLISAGCAQPCMLPEGLFTL